MNKEGAVRSNGSPFNEMKWSLRSILGFKAILPLRSAFSRKKTILSTKG